jgi:ribonuclease HI
MPWKYHNLFICAFRYADLLGSVSYCHVLREANHMVDNLAKQGVNRVSEFLAWI